MLPGQTFAESRVQILEAQTQHYQVLYMMQLSALQNKLCFLIHHAISFQVWNSLDSWKHHYSLL